MFVPKRMLPSFWKGVVFSLLFSIGTISAQITSQLDFTNFDQCGTNVPQTPLFLGSLSLNESLTDDFQMGTYSFNIETPSNFEIQTSGLFTAGADITSASVSNINPSTLQITLTVNSLSSLDQLVIENLSIQNTTGATTTDGHLKFLEGASAGLINGLADGQIIASLSFTTLIGGEALSQHVCRRSELQDIVVINDNITQNRSFEWQSLVNGVWETIPNSDTESLSIDSATLPTGISSFRRATSTTVNGEACTVYSIPSQILLNEIHPGSITEGIDQTLCPGDTPLQLSSSTDEAITIGGSANYQWYENQSGTWVEIVGATNSFYQSGTLSQTTTFRRRITNIFNGFECFEETASVTILVLNSIAGGTITDQSICTLHELQLLTVNNGESNANYQWQIKNSNDIWEDISGANDPTFDASATILPGINELRRITTRPNESCEGISNVATIINLNFEVGAIEGNQTICYGELPEELISLSSAQGSGNLSYQWQLFNGTDWVDISGANNPTYQPEALQQNTSYRRLDTATLNSYSCSEITNEISITVLPELMGGDTSADQTVCFDGLPADITVTGGSASGANTSYQWQSKTTGEFVNLTGETNESLSFNVTPTSTTTYRREVLTTNNSVICSAYSSESTIFVNIVVPGVLVENQNVCFGEDAPTLFATAATQAPGNISFQWESSIDNGATWSAISGATLATYTPNSLSTDTSFRRLDTSTLNSVVCSAYTNETAVVFADEIFGGSAQNDQTVCLEDIPQPLIIQGGTPSGAGISFQWHASTDNITFAELPGETAEMLNFSSGLTESTYFQREVILDFNGTNCNAFSSPVLITLINLSPGSIGDSQTLCDGTNIPTLTSTEDALSNGTITYSWQQSEDLETWVDLPNTNQSTYAPPPIEERITYFRRQATATLNGIDCEAFTEPIVLFVNRFEDPELHEIQFSNGATGSTSICNMADPPAFRTNFTLLATGDLSYQWQSSPDNITFNDINGATDLTYDPPAVTTDIFYRRITTSTLNSLSCSLTSNVLHYVNGGDATGGTIGTTNANGTNGANEEVICAGDIPSEIIELTPSTGQNLSYQWFANNSPIAGETGTGLVPANPIFQTTNYVRVTYSTNISGLACEVESSHVTVLVPQADSIGPDFAICVDSFPGTLGDVTLIDGIDYLTFQWYDSNDGTTFTPISGATGATFTPNVALSNDHYYRRGYIATIDNVVCGPEELSNTLQVFINHIDGGANIGNQNVCFEGDPSLLENSIAGAARGVLTYEWYSSEDNLNWTIIENADQASFKPEPSRRVTTHFRRTSISEFMGMQCTSESNVVTVAVGEEILPGTLTSEQTVCEGETPTILTVTGGSNFVDQTTTWFSSLDGVVWSAVATNSNDYSPPALFETTYYKRSTSRPSFVDLTCTVETNVLTIHVNKVTSGSINDNQTLCEGDQPKILFENTSAIATGNISYQWFSSTDNQNFVSIDGATASTFLPSSSLTTSTYFKRQAISTLNGVDCSADTAPVLLTIVPYPIIASEAIIANDVTHVSCFDGNDGRIIIPNERLSGGNTVQEQINTITFFGQPQLGSTYTAIINGITYEHTVVVNSSNQVQTNEEIASSLAAIINNATGNDLSAVLANASSDELLLIAKVAGTAFTAFVSTDSSNNSGASIVVTQENRPGHTYEWSKVGNAAFTANTLSISDLSAGIYHLTVFNGSCGVTSDAILVSEPEELVLEIADSCNTAITVKITGGVAPYTFTLTRPDGSTLVETTNIPSMTFTGLDGSAIYTISVRDAICSIPVSQNINLPSGLQFDASSVLANNISCFGANNGSISLNNGTTTVSGGFPPYNFNWTGPNNETYTAQNLENLSPGVYQLLVTDQVGCSSVFTTEIASKAPLEITNLIVVNEQLQCAGDENAEIGFQVQADPSAQLQINWLKNGTSFATNTTYMNNLGPGQYELRVMDVSGNSEDPCITSELVEIIAPELFSASEVTINDTSCYDPQGQRSFSFRVNGGVAPYQYQLNGGKPAPFNDELHTITGLNNANHTISVTDANACVTEVFNVAALSPIAYNGLKTFMLEPCMLTTDFSLDTTLVSGGEPYVDTNGLPYYLYDWVGPDNFVAQDITSFTAGTGSYFLTITDANSCISELIEFFIGTTYQSLQVDKIITPVSCGNSDDGSIQVNITGGLRPYHILWEQELPGSEENPNPIFQTIAENEIALRDLGEGRLRLTITSDIVLCNEEDPTYYHQEIIEIPKEESLQIIEEPSFDTSLCSGNPGTLTIAVFDAHNSDLSFYYNENLVPSTEIDTNVYEVFIANPVNEANLNIINDQGCGVSELVSNVLAAPSFSYTSEEFELTQSLLLNQEIRFTNTSEQGYTRAVWDFGDGTPLLEINPLTDSTISVHQFQFAGTFDVTLTLYNANGCSLETTQTLAVGSGYDVMMPNVFSPNGDGINDVFQGEMRGVASFIFRIYDLWGGLVYETSHDINDLPTTWGWNGFYANGKPYENLSFRYLFIGKTGSNFEFTKTGEATLIRQQ